MLTAAFASAAALLAASIPSTVAHGYMLIPESQFQDSANSAWIVQIDPVWASDKWDGNNAGSVDTFKSLKSANNFKDLKTLMDDTSVYGADCGFTNPNGTPQPIPTDGKATFSRAIVHVGPCEIWLDDKKVLGLHSSPGIRCFDIVDITENVIGIDYTGTVKRDQSNTPLSGDSDNRSNGDSNTPSSGDSNNVQATEAPSTGDFNKGNTFNGNLATVAPASADSQNTWMAPPTTQGSSPSTQEATTAPSFSFRRN
ncbi:unnamed protein product [Phytophthora lilii]|uniref:Unnamed protein product n=1 Tax=Phytophthora lilii TaxID=2077276 RepID=A0A9W6Y3Q1_9STRA|nr:unnamed protein product [Phytophthora lilii]